MWVFSNLWRPRQKKATGGGTRTRRRRSSSRGGSEEENLDGPYQDSRDPSLSTDGISSTRYYTDIEGGCQDYRDSSVDGSTSGNTPILDRTDRRSSLKPIVSGYCVESSPIRLPSPTRSRWARLQRSCLPFTRTESGPILPPGPATSADRSCSSFIRRTRKSCVFRWAVFVVLFFFITLGLLQFITLIFGVVAAFFPDDVDRLATFWGKGGEVTERLSRWPTELTRDVKPARCHSHNDYWRLVPLYSALHAGCISIEADVWMFDGELFVGHSPWSLNRKRTLESLYIDPLVDILDKQNPTNKFSPEQDQPLHGVFNTEPSQQLVLLVDFKNDGTATWPRLTSQLDPLRDRGYLTHFNGTHVVPGPIIVVGTGNTPFDLVTANSTYRDVFFDAPLDELATGDSQPVAKSNAHNNSSVDGSSADLQNERDIEKNAGNLTLSAPGHDATQVTPDITGTYNIHNSYYASVSFRQSIGSLWNFSFSSEQLDILRAQIRSAHERGLKVRYWNLPSWPRLLRNHVWTVLVREGVDLLNADDLKGATMEDWVDKTGIWRGWLWW